MAIKQIRHRFTKSSALLMVAAASILLIGGGATYAALGGSNPLASSATSVNLQRGLLGYYKLDGNLKDATPYGNNGTLNGSPLPALTTDRKGKANAAYAFTGVNNQYIRLSTGLNIASTGSYTISAWAQATVTTSDQVIFDKREAGPSNWYGMRIQANTGYAKAILKPGAATTTDLPGLTVVTDGNWHLLTMTVNRSTGTVSLYVDGKLDATTTFSSNVSASSSAQVRLGGDSYSGGSNLTGSIDDFRFYNRLLNAKELKALYENYNSGVTAGSGEKGLVGWWKMDGNAKDASPYTSNGTVTGATLTADRKGRANSAYNFDGVSDYVTLNDSATNILQRFYSNRAELTVSAWAKITGSGILIARRTNGPSSGYQIGVAADGKAYAYMVGASSSGTVQVNSTSVVTDNNWHLITATFDRNTGGSLKMYIDGLLQTTVANGGIAPAATQFTAGFLTAIGSDSTNANNNEITGAIDDVRIYSRVLSAAEVKTIADSYDSSIAIGGSGKAGSINLGKGLVGDFPFNGNYKDSTPNATALTSGPGLTSSADRKGRASSAFSTNGGSTPFLSCSCSILAPTTGITLSAWVYQTGANTTATGIIGMPSGGNYAFSISTTQKLQLTLYNTANQAITATSTASIPMNTWVHVTGTYDLATIRLYINGVADGTAALSNTAIPYGSNSVYIFRSRNASTTQWIGSIDDVRFYNRALTAAEVSALYGIYR